MRLVCIGCGKMGSALVEGVVRSELVSGGDVRCVDSHLPSAEALAGRVGGEVREARVDEGDQVLLVCVKPWQVETLLQGLASGLAAHRPLVVSVAAGVSLERLGMAAGKGVPVVRAMPNTPALIGRGAAAFSVGDGVSREQVDLVRGMLSAVGLAEEVPEGLLDAVTGVSGSGPAFIYSVIEAMADGACLMGMPKDMALKLAAQTVAGAAGMVSETGLHPAQLRDQVTSPGGTTIAGVAALEEAGLRAAMIAAVRASAERSAEMAREREK